MTRNHFSTPQNDISVMENHIFTMLGDFLVIENQIPRTWNHIFAMGNHVLAMENDFSAAWNEISTPPRDFLRVVSPDVAPGAPTARG